MGFDCRYLGEDEYPRLQSFIAEHWGESHPYVRKRALFDWCFRRSGLWDRDGYSWLYAEDEGAMISSLGAIPFELNLRGETFRAVWPVTWMTAEAYRKTGVGLWLFGMLRRPPFRAIVCFGAREGAADIYRALRFQMVDDIPRRVGFLPSQRDKSEQLIALTHPEWEASRVATLVDRYTVDSRERTGALVEGDAFWSRWDELGWAPWAPELIGAKRDAAYLGWRYRDHPEYDYRLIALEEAGRLGLLVWRLDPVHSDRATRIGSFARIVDFLPASAANAKALIADLWATLAELPDVMGADLYNYHGLTGRWLAELGMPLMADHPDGRGIPSGFQPIDNRCKSIPNAVWIRREEGPKYPLDPEGPWYWTKSDSDRDVPMW